MRTLDDLDLGTLQGEPVFVRVDFNVPMADDEVADDTRLTAALPTLNELRQAGARLVLASHRGRPKGEPDPALSLRPVAARLSELLECDVAFAGDSIGLVAHRAVDALEPGDVCLLENLRFHAGEKANDPGFAAQLAKLANAYVDDAFGTAHRAHASVVGVPERLGRSAAGRLLAREVETLGRLLGEPARPFVAVAGGAKIGGKMDTLVLGGGMANTFLASQGHDLERSLVEHDRLELAREILARAHDANVEVLLPTDLVVTDDLESPEQIETVTVDALPAGTMAVDIGEESSRNAGQALAKAATVFWNGPLGVFEKPPFDRGTVATAAALAEADAFVVIGGGETVAAARRANVLPRIERHGHVSTGGGAALEFLAGKELPGIAILGRAQEEAT